MLGGTPEQVGQLESGVPKVRITRVEATRAQPRAKKVKDARMKSEKPLYAAYISVLQTEGVDYSQEG